MKEATVIPVFKKGDAQQLSNYRPISILPFFAKFLEKIMYSRLNSFITNLNLIHPSQHGFQAGHSTYMALIDMEDKISKALDNIDYSVGIFIDLAKAFDTVDHKILLSKLENYGIRGIQLKWFKSYLEGRKQKVCCNDVLSDSGLITSGVPQGSNLGPLLFLLFINDLARVSSTIHFILFAYDTTIYYSNSSWESLVEIINGELSKVNKWFLANKLTLNVDKTNFINF